MERYNESEGKESDDEGEAENDSQSRHAPAKIYFQGDIVEAVALKFLNDEFSIDLNTWVRENRSRIHSEFGEEHNLQMTALHDEFKRMYEKKIEGMK